MFILLVPLQGADPAWCKRLTESSALHDACRTGKWRVARFLMDEHGMDPVRTESSRGNNQDNALHISLQAHVGLSAESRTTKVDFV